MSYPITMRRAILSDQKMVLAMLQRIDSHDWLIAAYPSVVSMAEPAGLYLALAETSGGLIGCYCLQFPAPDEAYLSGMRIHPEAQGRGIGSLFCRAQILQARTLGAGNIYLKSVCDNLIAHRTVQKNGFENLGEWVIYHVGIAGTNLPVTGRARWATRDDQPLIRQFRGDRWQNGLGGVICGAHDAYLTGSMKESDWAPADWVVVEGAAGLDALMCLGNGPDSVIIRYLAGSEEATAELLAFAFAERDRRERRQVDISLPAVAEPFLSPLALQRAEAIRFYVFRFSSDQHVQ